MSKEEGGEVNIAYEHGTTPLHFASSLCWKESAEIVHLLLDAGADVNATFARGPTPLSYAIRRGNFEVIKLLLENGADVNFTSDRGFTPLSLAIRMVAHIEMVKLLLENGADPDLALTDNIVFAALHSGMNGKEKLEELVKYGANYEDILNRREFSELTQIKRERLKDAVVRGLTPKTGEAVSEVVLKSMPVEVGIYTAKFMSWMEATGTLPLLCKESYKIFHQKWQSHSGGGEGGSGEEVVEAAAEDVTETGLVGTTPESEA